MHHDVGAERERLLQRRRRERVVARDDRAVAMREIGDGPDIGHLQQRIRRRFEPDAARIGLQRAGDGGEVAHVDGARFQAALRQELAREFAQAGVAVGWQQHVRAGRQRFEQRVHRGHAGPERERRAALFERGQRRLQARLRRIGLAHILVAGLAFAGRTVAERRCQMQRRRQRAGFGIGLGARVHRLGFKAHRRTPGRTKRRVCGADAGRCKGHRSSSRGSHAGRRAAA